MFAITKEKYAIFYRLAFEQDTINKKTQASLALTTGETECYGGALETLKRIG